jgi:hypothetical protein
MHRVSFEEGTALCRMAAIKPEDEARRLFERANLLFKVRPCFHPNSEEISRLPGWGWVFVFAGMLGN